MMSRPFLFFLLVLFSSSVFAQKEEVPIGEWRIHLPYNAVNSIAETPTQLFIGAERGFYSFHKKSGEMELFSKVNGFSDVEVQLLKYHAGLDLLLVAYENTNIDIMQGNSIFNISDILRKSILGEKAINDIHFEGNLAYLSCTFGIVIIDLERKAVLDSYLNIGSSGNTTVVNSVTFFGDSIYAATEEGILRAPRTGLNLSDFNSWQGPMEMQNNGNARLLRVFKGKMYCEVNRLLRKYDGTGWKYKGDTIPQYKRDTRSIEICHGQMIYVQVPERKDIDGGITIVQDDTTERFIRENVKNFAIIDDENSIWTGGDFTGLIRLAPNGQRSYARPNGPQRATSFSMTPFNGEMWVAGGGTSPQWNPLFSKAGFYRFSAGLWKPSPPLKDSNNLSKMTDAIVIAGNESTGDIFIGTHIAGLFHIKNEAIQEIFTDDNSPIVRTGDNYLQIDGLAFDSKNNLWMSNYDAEKSLLVRTAGGQFNSFGIGFKRATEIVVDRFDQKWIINRDNTSNVGIIVFKETEDPTSSTFQTIYLQAQAGKGNLPSTEVHALVVDEDGEIWIGTSEGLAVIYNPGGVFEDPEFAEAKRFIIDDGEDVGYLLGTETINDIQVDGANRKWVATNTGAWLIAADGSEVLRHFTAQNSPLLSNEVVCVGIMPETGEVFFGTSKGMVSYRGDATASNNLHGDVVIFPNPVRPGYDGPITINGLPENATVKITDISGRVVYEMISNGGTAVWDGNNFNGERAQTGIYLFITANEDDEDAHVTKLLLVN